MWTLPPPPLQGSLSALAKGDILQLPWRSSPAGGAPKLQSFPKMGRPPRPSSIPGEWDREPGFQNRGGWGNLDLTRALQEVVQESDS